MVLGRFPRVPGAAARTGRKEPALGGPGRPFPTRAARVALNRAG